MSWFERFGELDLCYTIDHDYRNGFFWSSYQVPNWGGKPPKPRPNGEVSVWLSSAAGNANFRPLGSYARHYGSAQDAGDDVDFRRFGRVAQLMIAPVSGQSGVVASPVDYRRLWHDSNTGAHLYGSVWRPIPPQGYVALGDVWMSGWDVKPPLNAIWCVKQTAVGGHTYVRRAELRERVWSDQGTGGNAGDVAVWRVEVPPISEDPSERLLLAPNTVTTVTHYSTPAPTDTTWILDVPAGVEKRPEPEAPPLTSYQEPSNPQPVTDRIVRVPFTGVNDEGRDLQWKVLNSPFYRLHRRVGYNRAIFTNNQHGTQDARASEQVVTGVVQSESEAWTTLTRIVVSASAGIAFKGLSVGADVNITRETGYEKRTSLTEFTESTRTQEMVTPPRASGVLWVKSHELQLYRADGSAVAEGLSFQFPSYAIANYPPNAVGQHIEPAAPAEPEFQQAPDLDGEKGGGIPGFDAEELTKKLELAKQEMSEQP
ncbi:Vps62-related protein [Streptomyces sp. NPDC020096]